ncbi:MAG TPA: response regulator transcription factor [Povalibacter sp.]|nr:response regulator transcription factor [Povalibacter sp.]
MQTVLADASRRILLVDDNPDLARLCTQGLSENGFTVSAVSSAAEMDSALAHGHVDLILLDVMLPDEDGFSICRRLRAASAIPIVMLSARNDETDRIVALETGADDYVVKPCNSRELVARIRALLRRARGLETARRQRALRFAGWRIDPVTREVVDPHGARIAMTSVEIDLLLVFCRNAGQVLSRAQLLDLLHGGVAVSIERSIDVHVSRIRQKLEADPRDPAFIKTVRLGGYVFTPLVKEA